MDETRLLVPTPRTILQQAVMRAAHQVTMLLEENGLSKHASIVIVLQGNQVVAHITNTPAASIVLKPPE